MSTDTFFVDRSLGRHVVVDALTRAAISAVAHDDHFSQTAADVEWLAETAKRGWIVLTKDSAIGRNPVERAAILHSDARVFVITNRNMTGPEMAELIVRSSAAMLRLARDTPAPFVFKIERSGKLTRMPL